MMKAGKCSVTFKKITAGSVRIEAVCSGDTSNLVSSAKLVLKIT
jgi:hypothetical protein